MRKNVMKKVTAAILAASMIFSLTACGGSDEPAYTPGIDTPAAETPAAQEPAAEAPAQTEESADQEAASGTDDLVAAAQAEGSLVVYGSCEEAYLSAACQKFEEMYGIKVDYQRLSTGEVYTKIEEEAGNPSGDVWFGGTTDPYNEAVAAGLLEPYAAQNASHLLGDMYTVASYMCGGQSV